MIIDVLQDAPLIEILLQYFPESNRTRLKKAVRFGCVSVQGAVIKHSDVIVKKGQKIDFKKYQARVAYKEKAPFRILFEDEEVIAVFKPAGILSSGRTTEKVKSMLGMVNSYVNKQSRGRCRAYTVHRLDREVSGILLFTKSEESKFFLQDHWKEVKKLYFALVEGVPEKPQGSLSSWLKENSRQTMYSVPTEEIGAKWAITHYNQIGIYGDNALLEINLETGRKNQIRVHLSEMGHPIVGDRKYGADASIKRKIRLLAYFISFPHPIDRKKVELEISAPKNFTSLSWDHEQY
ncbi:MAG: RluA family pseudouridine synthase [Bacteroidales bacterium]